MVLDVFPKRKVIFFIFFFDDLFIYPFFIIIEKKFYYSQKNKKYYWCKKKIYLVTSFLVVLKNINRIFFLLSMSLTWSNIDIEVPNKNKKYKQDRIKLVNNACGTFEKGLLAIMGPSGSGKTTLMNAFVGRIPQNSKTTGQILFNGQERKNNEWLCNIGFVDQDDSFYEQLTVFETVETAGRLRSTKNLTEIHEKMDFIFTKLGIQHITENRIKSISGGERKRVMIAVELISDPKVILLDEPTSGLDNNTAQKLIKLLKLLADEGILVIFTIHQPDDITASFFDKILLLSQGRSIYMGEYKSCEKYFVQNGFQKLPEESFSNFTMRIIDTESGVYQDSLENDSLATMISDVQKKYNTNYIEKKPRFSNDNDVYYTPNLKHFYVLLIRRLKLFFFKFKNLLKIFILTLVLVFLTYMFNLSALGPTTENNKEIKKEFDKINSNFGKEAQLSFIRYFYSTYIPFLACFVALLNSPGFDFEKKQVKRELGVNAYSIGTYYLVLLAYDYILSSLPLISYYIALSFLEISICLRTFDYLIILFLFLFLIPFKLLFCNLSDNSRANKFFSTITLVLTHFGFFNSFPPNFSFDDDSGLTMKILYIIVLIIPTQFFSYSYRKQLYVSFIETLGSKTFSKEKIELLPSYLIVCYYFAALIFIVSVSIILFAKYLNQYKRYRLNQK